MSYYDVKQNLVGKKVLKIFMNEQYLKFETDKGNVVFSVSGDCCSSSYFFDFYGVKKLFTNGPITEVKEVELLPSDIIKTSDGYEKDSKREDSSISVYGYQITTEDKELGPCNLCVLI